MMQPTPASPALVPLEPRTQPRLTMRYLGTGGGLFLVAAKNLLLTVVTFGIYLPWARTERRKYLWQNVEIGGQRLRYHGTGLEVFVGYLKVALVYAAFFGIPAALRAIDHSAGIIAQIVALLAIFPLIPIAIYGSRRYRFSRTSLRGVRFGLDGGAGGFLKLFLVTQLLTIITLGIYGPIANNRLHAYLTRHSRYGTEPFQYDGDDGEAWKIVFFGWVLTLVTLGFYYPWLVAKLQRFRFAHTTLQGARGNLDITGADVFSIMALFFFGTLFSLGLALPWITTFALDLVTKRLSFSGPIDFSRIQQGAIDGSAAADDLASALDAGIDF